MFKLWFVINGILVIRMGKNGMKSFLTMKLMYQYGTLYSRSERKAHWLLAIHNCHYVVEQVQREYLTDQYFDDGALHFISFYDISKKQMVYDYTLIHH